MRRAAIIVIALSAAACGNIGKPTPYRASYDGMVGYGSKVTDLGGNRYTIYNDASPISPDETPLEHNMLRAAQLAQEKGFGWFRVEESKTGMQGRPVPIIMPPVFAPENTITIRLLAASDGGAETFASVDIIASLGPKYLKSR